MAAHDAVPDSDLQLKKRARRRLVGAAALALLAIIVLPMVMDHEPRPPVQEIQVRIPSQDGVPALGKPISKTVAANPDTHAEVKPESTSAVKADAKAEPKPEAKVEPKTGAAPGPKTAVSESAKPATTGANTAATPAAVPAAPSSEKKPVDTAKAPADAPGQWVVQLGAYKEGGNVKLLLSKLKEMGVPAYTEKFDTPQGLRTRVRAGPFPSREAAEKAHKKVKIIGVDGPVAPR